MLARCTQAAEFGTIIEGTISTPKIFSYMQPFFWNCNRKTDCGEAVLQRNVRWERILKRSNCRKAILKRGVLCRWEECIPKTIWRKSLSRINCVKVQKSLFFYWGEAYLEENVCCWGCVAVLSRWKSVAWMVLVASVQLAVWRKRGVTISKLCAPKG